MFKEGRFHLESEEKAGRSQGKPNFRIINEELAGIGDEGFVWNPYGSTVTNFRKGNLAVFIFVSTTGPDDEKRLGKEFAKYTDDALNAYPDKLY